MDQLVTYDLIGSVATITMDDGKVNALSPQMFAELAASFDRAANDNAVVVLSGRPGIFSAGFDLSVLRGGGAEAIAMLRAGFELSERMLSFPTPVVIACTGHAMAMGVFVLLSGDYRIGVSGAFKLVANEVAIGMTMPLAAVEIVRQRLAPAFFNRAIILAELFSPDNAVEAGLLDRVVEAPELRAVANDTAIALAKLDMAAHLASKLRVREHTLQVIRAGIDAEFPATK